MNVFMLGRENLGWSIDYDRKHTELFLLTLGHRTVRTPITADVIHAVWWNRLLKPWNLPLRWKPIIATLTNDPIQEDANLDRAAKFVDLWIAPSERSVEELESRGYPVEYQPFYVDERLFTPLNANKSALAARLGLDDERLDDRLVIGSFQRDSLGADRSQPKWQKNPELLVDVAAELDPESFVLLLAGPRRHWLLEQCEKRGIPHVYYGERPTGYEDDIRTNVVDKRRMNLLYNLIDVYLVSSASEGGPKAVLECGHAKTPILSTDVGLAPDILPAWSLYQEVAEAASKLRSIKQGKSIAELVERSHETVRDRAGHAASLERWHDIYDRLEDLAQS